MLNLWQPREQATASTVIPCRHCAVCHAAGSGKCRRYQERDAGCGKRRDPYRINILKTASDEDAVF